MRVLIVGCGYVGLPLAVELVRQGHEVFGLRRSRVTNAELIAVGVKPIQADITKPETLAGLPKPIDWVVSCVASGGGDAEDYRRLYLEGTQNLLAHFASSPPTRFIYISSTGVYGQNDGSLVDESSPTEPATATAQVLVETERFLIESARERNFPAAIVRAAGIYGPERGYLLKQFLRGEARIEGRGERIMNMIHRDDLIGAVIAALQHSRAGEIYNVTDDEPVSQMDFFRWLSSRLGKSMPPTVSETESAPRKRGLTSKRISNRKLKDELGLRLAYPTYREGYTAELQRLGMGPVS